MENPFTTQENTPKRSTLLTVFLVLTFIGSGFAFIGNIYTSLGFETLLESMEEAMDDDALTAFSTMLEQSVKTMTKAGSSYFGLLALLALISLTGAILMWKLNKYGFHLYASVQIILLFIPMLFGLVKLPGLFETGMTALFIWVYARELRIFNSQEN